jgi:glutamine synthetase
MSDTETGPGVFETALAYTDSGRMADNAILFKFVAKSVGMKYGITPTFMAKPYSDVRPPLSILFHCNVILEGGRELIIDARNFWSYSRIYP